MRKAISFLLLSMIAAEAMAQDICHTRNGMRAEQTAGGYTTEVVFYSPAIARVMKQPTTAAPLQEKSSLSVVLEPQLTKIAYKETAAQLVMTTAVLRVVYDKATGTLSFTDLRGNTLLREKEATFVLRQEGADAGAYQVKQAFLLDDEAIYGLGQFQNGKMNQRYTCKELIQGNTEDVVPLLHSVKGYGIFWDNTSPTMFTDTAEETAFASEVGEGVDYYFLCGGNGDGVVAAMRLLTGQVPMLPLWIYGYWQCRERYKTQDEVVEVVENYRRRRVPLDGIIQDWQYWGNNYLWNAMEFLSGGYSNPQYMMEMVHGMNAHIIISIWSSFGPQTKPYRALQENGMLLPFETWPRSGSELWPPRIDYPSGVRVYDAYDPAARDIYWDYANKGLFAWGMDGWWMDSTEPDRENFTDADYEGHTYLGSYRKVCNAYPLMSVGGVYTHQRATTSQKRVFILTRSAFAGQQRYGANTWSGDITASWETLRCQIPAGLNFSLTGIPHWNNDIGGFYANAYNNAWGDNTATQNPLYRELYVRWMQFGAFTPMMRSHGTEVPREIYYYGEKGEPIYDALEKAIRLRYTLLPYIYSTSWAVSRKQATFMRALFMDFAHDRQVWDINDEYMFGNALLVAPIVKAQYTQEEVASMAALRERDGDNAMRDVDFTAEKSTEVYLPSGTLWYDFWSNEQHTGGQRITCATTIDRIPLFCARREHHPSWSRRAVCYGDGVGQPRGACVPLCRRHIHPLRRRV